MIREYKGTSVKKHVDNYCVVDLETTGVFVGSADIIEISALKVRDNKVVEKYSTLVNPHYHIPDEATAVNHITDEMVAGAPDISEVIGAFFAFVGTDVIVGYNNASFDMNILYDKSLEIIGFPFTNDYIDLLHSARRCLVELENHKLETVSKHYKLDTEGEHRALKDCYLTKDCYDKLYADFGDEAFYRSSKSSGNHPRVFSAETTALRELQSFLENIIEDGKVTEEEFYSLKKWMEEHRDLQGNYPFDRVFDALDKVLEDGIVTPEELEELQILFAEFVDPVGQLSSHDRISNIYNKHVCVTGDFNYGSRDEVTKLIESVGGIIDKGVKKATDYVVVGSKGSSNWKTGNYGSKIQKALELNDKGSDIKIVEENDFIPMLNNMTNENNDEESLDANESDDSWKERIQSMLNDMVKEYELPDQSLYLKTNYGRTSEKITSYSVSIYEPEYPPNPRSKVITKNQTVLNIKEKKDSLELIIGKIQFGDIAVPENAEVKFLQSDEDNVHVLFAKESVELVDYIRANTKYSLANYESKASTFGCCSRFNDCSDAKKCVHENKLYSKACMYRRHLDSGKIFYGKNRNID